MVLNTTKDIIQIHLVEFFALGGVILIISNLNVDPKVSHRSHQMNIRCDTHIFCAPYFKTTVNSSLLRLSGLFVSLLALPLELR